jgi:hypothetical protein
MLLLVALFYFLPKLTNAIAIESVGQLVLELGKPVKANKIRVVFDCKEMEKSKCLATIFSIESALWSAVGECLFGSKLLYIQFYK